MNRKISPIEELAIDAFLAELHGQPAPDLSKQILAQWNEISVANDSQADGATASRHPRVEVAASHRRLATDKHLPQVAWKFATVIAAIAAAVLVAVWIGRDATNINDKRTANELAASDQGNTHSTTIEPTTTPHSLEIARGTLVTPSPSNLTGNLTGNSNGNAPGNPTTVPDPNDASNSAERKPLKGIPLAMESSSEPSLPEWNEPEFDVSTRIKVPTLAPEKLKAVTLVAKQIDTNLHDYWSSIGIQAAQEADVAEITQRLSSVLEITVPEHAIESAESFERFLSNPKIARGVASQFMSVVTEGGFKKLDPENQSLLLKELANCFESNQPFDETLAAWISGDSENSLRWYSANADDGVHPLARRLATLTMNVDVRCIKCHDSIIDSRGTQSEYWAFTGLLERSVSRKNKKVVSITTDRTTDDLVFFETLEGLQKVVEAGVPAGWIAGSGNTAAMDLKQWSQRVVGSRELARGVVNSMWRMIHGRPLRGSVVDLSTPPHTESLGSLERRLVDDLIDSRFNIARTLALVVSTPSTRRSVPLPLRADQIAMASQAEIDHGNMLVGAFAATAPQHASLPVGKRVRFASQSVGSSLDAIRKETMLLAQTLDASNSNAKSKNSETKPPAKANVTIEQFPANAAGPPVQWLTLIDDLDQKVNHLAYLVPMQQVPKSVTEVVDKMVTQKTSEPLILHRVWWMIHP